MERRQKGNYGESEACKFLVHRGYKIIDRNFRFSKQEIDIIALDNDTLVFVEVRGRQEDMVSPEESIGKWKQKHIIRTAQFYLQKRGWQDLPCRFDVVTILYHKDTTRIKKIDLICDAFESDR